MKLLAVTSCPNGIAHTYMAAEKLAKTAEEMGAEIKVETQGSIGAENELTAEEIQAAEGIILAVDKSIDRSRFEGKRVVECPIAEAIRQPEQLIQRFTEGNVPVYRSERQEESAETADPEKETGEGKKSRAQNPIYRSLMNGVSYMIPFVVVGGLLIALSLGLGGEPTAEGLVVPEDSFWAPILQVGESAFLFMVPILAGFIAVSIADRPGLAPGMIGGYIAAEGSFYGSEAGAGFIGGIIAGFLAGYIAKGIKSIPVPQVIQPIMPILVIPLAASILIAVSFIYILGSPIASLMEGLTAFLNGMQGSSKILLALVLGAMISFDMGGPVNKVAFLFGAAMIGEGQTFIMGALAAAICTPPLGMGLASLLAKHKYQKEEEEVGKAALAMGLVGITEGAIPFAAGDPLRVIPSIMIGSMTASAIAMTAGVTDNVPHGGPIVAVFQAIGNVPMFFAAIAAGTVVTALMVNLLKKPV
ncbi:PTS fructose transporter subunit IIBC [Paludifilum halophilum]|uniref:PTS fructose transporter subunit IIBC n=1 Tax=Paludifilum halophilum TaxID=1642702 RepID=A0A235BAA4_9BACL|nr:PTS fructose transporter subunit IIBC [Paludifilum halophilum]